MAIALLALLPKSLLAVQQSGSVRAADQVVPGATVTARQGDTKVVAYTDENGRYTLNLAPGVWDIQVQILGFTTVQNQVTVAAEPVFKDWTLEMPRLGGTSGPAIPASAAAAIGDLPCASSALATTPALPSASLTALALTLA